MSQNNRDKGSPCINPKCLLKCKLQNIEHCTYSVNGISPYRVNTSRCNLQKWNRVLLYFIVFVIVGLKKKQYLRNPNCALINSCVVLLV